jgi:hypothetical protein
LRVTVLGDGKSQRVAHDSSYLADLEALLPGVRVSGTSSVAPREYAARLSKELARRRPELVLAVISVGEDITAEGRTKSVFDWRELGLTKLLAAEGGPPTRGEKSAGEAADMQEFLRSQSPQLVVCRTPIDESMHAHWKRTLAGLRELAARCKSDHLPLALVVVPAEFQVSRNLCDTLRRRQGIETKNLDLELPQRRLAAIAEEQGIAMIDLLPYLRQCEEPPYVRNTAQWNSQGQAVAARAVGGWLQSRFGAQVAATTQLTSRR